MLLRAIVLSVLLFITASGFAAGNTGQYTKEKDFIAQYTDDGAIVYKWIDGVRWAFVYGPDGSLQYSYPDPEE